MEQMTEAMAVQNIEDKVYVIRGQQVMLDYDLAEIYGYEVKILINKLSVILRDFRKILCFS